MSTTYVYGFVPPAARLPIDGLLGVGDVEVELLTAEGFAAVLATLPDSEFAGSNLERNTGDVDWMASQGLRHEQVIAWFVDHASILPSRFLTLFSSTEPLAEVLERDGARIRGALRRFEGLREWDLKVGYDAAKLEEHLGEVSEEIGRLDREIEQATPGKAFLMTKKRRDLARTEGRAAARRLAHQLLASLEPDATEVSRLALTAEETPVVLNAALLIPRERESATLERANREALDLARLGIAVWYTGPWAPYRFLEGTDVR
jgi:hypothetical protein